MYILYYKLYTDKFNIDRVFLSRLCFESMQSNVFISKCILCINVYIYYISYRQRSLQASNDYKF